MRSTLSPAFTSSKIKLMVPFMEDVGDQMIRTLKKKIKDSDCMDGIYIFLSLHFQVTFSHKSPISFLHRLLIFIGPIFVLQKRVIRAF